MAFYPLPALVRLDKPSQQGVRAKSLNVAPGFEFQRNRGSPRTHPILWLQQPTSVKNDGTSMEDLPAALLGVACPP